MRSPASPARAPGPGPVSDNDGALLSLGQQRWSIAAVMTRACGVTGGGATGRVWAGMGTGTEGVSLARHPARKTCGLASGDSQRLHDHEGFPPPVAAGLQAVLEFSRTDLEQAVVTRASGHGVAVDGLERYRAGEGPPAGDGRAGLVIGYGRPPEHAFTAALARLCAALAGEPAGRLLPLPYPRGQGEPGRPAVRIEGVMTIEDSVIIGVAAICVFVAVLVLALRMSAQRRAGPENPKEPENLKNSPNRYGPRMRRGRRLVGTAAPAHTRGRGRWEGRAASFGRQEDEEYGGSAGYGRPAGYGPPPLWTEPPHDPPGWR